MPKAQPVRLVKLGGDPRELPAYRLSDAAHYLRLPRSTLRAWVLGQEYLTEAGPRFFQPIIQLPDQDRPMLSFMNLVEAHVLDAIRRQHRISLQKVRKALQYLSRHFHSRHPLAEHRFETNGVDLFLSRYGELVNLSRDGQLAIRKILEGYLQRIERDDAGMAARLYLFTRKRDLHEPKVVMIDPRISFGRPVLAGTGIATAVIAERYKAGETIDELAEDYGRGRLDIEEAIRCELELEAA